MFKTKDKQWIEPLFVAFILAITISVHLNTCQTGKGGFLDQKGSLQQDLTTIHVWKPKDVFAKNSFFLAKNRFVIDFASKNGVF
jgi:hypothetical protein